VGCGHPSAPCKRLLGAIANGSRAARLAAPVIIAGDIRAALGAPYSGPWGRASERSRDGERRPKRAGDIPRELQQGAASRRRSPGVARSRARHSEGREACADDDIISARLEPAPAIHVDEVVRHERHGDLG
jgi:hypothetical protein